MQYLHNVGLMKFSELPVPNIESINEDYITIINILLQLKVNCIAEYLILCLQFCMLNLRSHKDAPNTIPTS